MTSTKERRKIHFNADVIKGGGGGIGMYWGEKIEKLIRGASIRHQRVHYVIIQCVPILLCTLIALLQK